MKERMILFLCCSILTVEVPPYGQKNQLFSTLEVAAGENNGPYLLVFFSTSCQVCWKDLIEMKYFIDKNNISIRLIGVSRDLKDELNIFIEKYSIDCAVVIDTKGKLYQKYKVELEPYKIIILNKSVFYRDSYYESFQEREKKIKEVLLELNKKFSRGSV